MDINSGYVLEGTNLVNLYRPSAASGDGSDAVSFTAAEYDLYRTTIERIRDRIKLEFELDELYITAPTFITRIIGSASWRPSNPHDEYWVRLA